MAYKPNMGLIYGRLIVLVIMLTISSTIMAEEPARQYVGSQRSDKFHALTCEWAQKISPGNVIYFASVEEAQAAAYKPCKVCLASVKPPPNNEPQQREERRQPANTEATATDQV